MTEAFPNMWILYKGAAEGKRLVQRDDGTVLEVDERESVADAVPAISFSQACHDFISTGRTLRTAGTTTTMSYPFAERVTSPSPDREGAGC